MSDLTKVLYEPCKICDAPGPHRNNKPLFVGGDFGGWQLTGFFCFACRSNWYKSETFKSAVLEKYHEEFEHVSF